MKCYTVGYAGVKLGSIDCRLERSSYILASWCGEDGYTIQKEEFKLRPGVISYFLKQNILVDGEYKTFILAKVRWFQRHPARDRIGRPHEVWCKSSYVVGGPVSFIPIQRILSQFVTAYETVDGETVLVVCPLQRKLYN